MQSTLNTRAPQWTDTALKAAARTRRRRPTLYLAAERRGDGTVITYDPRKQIVQATKITSQAGTEERYYGKLGEVVKEIKTIASDTQGNSLNEASPLFRASQK